MAHFRSTNTIIYFIIIIIIIIIILVSYSDKGFSTILWGACGIWHSQSGSFRITLF